MSESSRPTIAFSAAHSLVVRLLFTVLLACLVPLIVNIAFKDLRPAEQFFIGLGVLLVTNVAAMGWDLRQLSEMGRTEQSVWEVKDRADQLLTNMRKSYYDLVACKRHADDLLFVETFEEELAHLADRLYEAATRHDLFLQQTHFKTTHRLLGSLTGKDADVCRFVHFFADNEFMYGEHMMKYFYTVANMVEDGRIKEVRRLFIYSAADQLTSAASVDLLNFHHHTDGFSYRILSDEDYGAIARDFSFPDLSRDFGVYGPWYVYRTKTASRSSISGVFSNSERTIRAYIDLFDTCWDSPKAFEAVHTPGVKPTVETVFGGGRPKLVLPVESREEKAQRQLAIASASAEDRPFRGY